MKKKDNQIVIPEDLSSLNDVDLGELHDKAVEAFQALLPAEGEAPTNEALEAMGVLAEGIEAVKGEAAERDAAALGRSSAAKDLADKVLSAGEVAQTVADENADEDPADAETEVVNSEVEDEALVAGAAKPKRRRPISIDLGALKSETEAPAKETETETSTGPRVIGFAAQGAAGYDVGAPVTVADMAKSINSRLGGFNASAYQNARRRGVKMSDRFTIARLQRNFEAEAIVESEDPRDALNYVSDEGNTPQGSLTASGGWCAPSETLYELVDISEASNLVSIPEIQINRGGVRHTLGPDYRTVFEDTGFCFTEAEDIAAADPEEGYDGEGGPKPCATVPCPDFTDVRLGYCGVCIGAGLMQQRGYPEVIEDYINKTLNAHAHRVSASVINSMAGSATGVVFPGPQVGASAPLLTAVDLQATHYRAVNRMDDKATLEVLLPTWVKAVLRSDLARRLGLAEFEVSDQRINAWFTNRNVKPQYVVDWQDISTTAAGSFTAAPTGVEFLLYAAGTYVKGVTDSITFENVYDSVLLGKNDYTALFTEDPYLVLKRNHDSRKVTVPLAATGGTHSGVEIAANGTEAA